MKNIYSAIIIALATVTALTISAHPAQAQTGLIFQALPSAAAPGGTGGFDVNVFDSGGTFDVSGFSFELSVPGASGVTFTSVDANTTAPYIFGTLQLSPFSFDTFPTTNFTASDASFTQPYFTTLNTGDTFGLGHISYSVAPGSALGPVTVTFVPAGTSLSDVAGNTILSTSLNGAITVAAVPEASTTVSFGLLLALGLGGAVIAARRKTAQ